MARTNRRGFAEERSSGSGFGGATATPGGKSGRIELRTTAETKELLQRAAASMGKTVTDFVLDAGIGLAEKTLLDRQVFRLDEAQWESFYQALDRPPGSKPRLRRLLNEKSIAE